jgi:hypothetical protein
VEFDDLWMFIPPFGQLLGGSFPDIGYPVHHIVGARMAISVGLSCDQQDDIRYFWKEDGRSVRREGMFGPYSLEEGVDKEG